VSERYTVGIDPGGGAGGSTDTGTGLVWRRDDQYLAHQLVLREAGESMASYIGTVVAQIRLWKSKSPTECLLSVEDIVEPTPQMGLIALRGLLVADAVLGAVLGVWGGGVMIIPPGHNGEGPLSSYPPELVGRREVAGGGWRRHLRSAWDVSSKAISQVERFPSSRSAEMSRGDAPPIEFPSIARSS